MQIDDARPPPARPRERERVEPSPVAPGPSAKDSTGLPAEAGDLYSDASTLAESPSAMSEVAKVVAASLQALNGAELEGRALNETDKGWLTPLQESLGQAE